jgi:hypothetical protein
MKRIYSMFIDWEDYQNGMYSGSMVNIEYLLPKAIELLSDDCLFFQKGLEMILNWKICTDYNLTNTSLNRRAWIGQATCCYVHKVPEIITRLAWSEMEEISQIKANAKANKIIKIYEERYNELYKNMGTKMLF